MTEVDRRPSPEDLLKEAGRGGRGRLKIFLGAAPGVGKTYAMLAAAHQRLAQGVDVAAAVVETHGRAETEALVQDLPQVRRRHLTYLGRSFAELDLDAVIERRPQLALVDELAHTNVPGSRHTKRHQDVEELLEAGIDVYTTLNVQHLESLNDIVERIAHIRVRETVPDRVLEQADEIELIDLPPEELIQRLHEGKVYVPEQAQRALKHFFSRGNLLALRELALRAAAERVDAAMLSYMRSRAIEGPWPTRERTLVGIGASRDSEHLVRLTKRMADQRQTAWLAVHVETPRGGLDEAGRQRVQQAMELVEQLGGEAVTLSGQDIVAELLAFAERRNVSQIVIGPPRRRRLRLGRGVAARLLAAGRDYNITMAGRALGSEPPAPRRRGGAPTAGPYLEATGFVAASAGLAFLLSYLLTPGNLSLVFLAGVLLAAVRGGPGPALYTSMLSVLSFNFLFTQPRYTLSVTYRSDVLMLLFFLLVAVVAGNLAARVRSQMTTIRENARTTRQLYDFSRRVSGAVGRDDLAWSLCEYLNDTLECSSVVLLGPAAGELEAVAGETGRDALVEVERSAAEWAYTHNRPAGHGTGTLPASRWYFLPLRGGARSLGVVGIAYPARRWSLEVERGRLLRAMRDQAALALERMLLTEDVEQARLRAEADELRSALLSSVSHDLRTPLVSIIGSVTTLLEVEGITAADRRELLETALDEAERLNRFVQNLLDMTRLGHGALSPNPAWVDLRDVVAEAARRLQRPLADHPLQIEIPPASACVRLDAVLLQQVLVNLLDNAAKYSPPGTPITVRSDFAGLRVGLEVSDAGPGIPPEQREAVFDMFHRVGAGDSRTAGTGLGLAISRGLIEAMGGEIHVLDPPARAGATIRISLPVEAPGRLPQEEPV